MAVMLRSVGIPARVVGGFQRGEWNPYGGFYMVRPKDAHSWVEAFLDRPGWVSFDPSPRAPPQEARSPVGLFLSSPPIRRYRPLGPLGLRHPGGRAAGLGRAPRGRRGGLRAGRLGRGHPPG